MPAVSQYGPEVVLNGATLSPIVMPNTNVTVKNPDNSAAVLYTDATGTTTRSNIVATDSRGQLTFFAAAGSYTISYTDLVGAQTLALQVPTSAAEDRATYRVKTTPEQYGAVGDGTTDDTAAVLAAHTALAAIGGGTLLFSPNKTYKCLGSLAPAFTGPAGAPVQKSVRWTSDGVPSWNGYWATNPLSGGATLDLRYDGTDTLHPAKIDTRGAGFLEIDHLNIVSGGADDFPIFQTTNTTVDLHHNFVQGNTAKSGTACVQDAFVLGGSTTSGVIGSLATSPFQGYGSRVHDNYFSHIRRGFLGQAYCNQIPVENNTFSTSCGSSTTGAIEWRGKSGEPCTGATTRGNTIEVVSYKYGIAVYNTFNSNFGPDGFYDPTAAHTAAIYVDSTSQYNDVVDGYRNDNYPLVVDAGFTTTVRTAHQSQPSISSQPQRSYAIDLFMGQAGYGPSVMDARGTQAAMYATPGNFPYPELRLSTINPIQVADGVTTSGSAVVTSATAAWTALDVGLPIFGPGIPTTTYILSRQSATQVTLSQNCTATASGVTFTFGRVGGAATDHIGFNRLHIVSKGGTPSPAASAAAGVGATVAASGTDTAYTLTLTTGTGPTAGQQCSIGAAINWSATQKLCITPKNAAAGAVMGPNGLYLTNTNANAFLFATTALGASTIYIFDVLAIQ